MPSTEGQALINSLSSVAGCGGKCSCCDSLQQQINQLKAQIKDINPQLNQINLRVNNLPDENNLIQKALAILLPGQAKAVASGIAQATQGIDTSVIAREVEKNIIAGSALVPLIGLIVTQRVAPIVAQQSVQAAALAALRGTVGGYAGAIAAVANAVS